MSSIRTIRTLGAPAGAFTSKRGGAFALRASCSVIGATVGSGTGRMVRSRAAWASAWEESPSPVRTRPTVASPLRILMRPPSSSKAQPTPAPAGPPRAGTRFARVLDSRHEALRPRRLAAPRPGAPPPSLYRPPRDASCGHASDPLRARLDRRGRGRPRAPRWPGGPLVRERRLRPRGDRAGSRRADARGGVLPLLLQHHDRADGAVGGAPGRARARAAQPHDLQQLGFRGQRDGAEADPRLLEAPRALEAHEDPRAQLRLSRRNARDDEHDGAAELHRPVRSAAAGLRAGPGAVRVRKRQEPGGVRRLVPRRDGADDRARGRGDGRGALRGADPGRGRCGRTAAGLPRQASRDLQAQRDPVRGGRSHHGLRPARRVVRLRALVARSGPDDHGQGDHQRVRAARGNDGERRDRGGARSGRLPRPRLHVHRPSHRVRGGAREPGHPRAGERSSSACATTSARPSSARCSSWPITRPSPRCAATS